MTGWGRVARGVGLLGLLLLSARNDWLAAQDSLERDYASELPRIEPLEPMAALQAFERNPDLAIELVAAEPLVRDPVAICFDAKGRAFVVEMRGYSERQDENLGTVRRLEDRDGDGVFETSQLFADGFRWPTAVVCAFDGILVGDAPDILYLKDSDDDGQADRREVWMTGFGTSNTQQLPNSFQWGLDNRIVGASGGNGGMLRVVGGPVGMERAEQDPIDLRGRDFCLDPKSFRLTSLTGGTQFGMTFDSEGNRFFCSNSDHCQQVVMEDAYLARRSDLRIGAASQNIAVEGPAAEVFRISPVEPWRKVRTRLRVQQLVPGPVEGGGRAAGYFTSATGITCYSGDALPDRYRGNLFVGDVGSNLVHRKQLSGNRIPRVAKRVEPQTEFLRSPDNWFRPVQMANAPDGGLWILDMYRETIEHPASLPPLIKRHLDLNSGNERGRIYRVRAAGNRVGRRTLPGEVDVPEWVGMLDHPNGWHRQTAARLLWETRGTEKGQFAVRLLREQGWRAIRAEARIRMLYLCHDLDSLRKAELLRALADPAPAVRVHALKLAEHSEYATADVIAEAVTRVHDPDLRVRFQTALSAGAWPMDPDRRAEALADLAARDGSDPWMRAAVTSSLEEATGRLIVRLLGRVGRGGQAEDGCRAVLDELWEKWPKVATIADADAMANWLDEYGADRLELRADLLLAFHRAGPDIREALERPGRPSLDSRLEQVMDGLAQVATDRTAAERDRVAAFQRLSPGRVASPERLLRACLAIDESPTVQEAAIQWSSRQESVRIAEVLAEGLQSLGPTSRGRAMQVLLAREAWTEVLLERMEQGELPVSLIAPSNRQRLIAHPHEPIRLLAQSLLGSEGQGDRGELIARYLDVLSRHPGNASRGKELFEKNCQTCHRLGGAGNEIGPSLAAFANRGAEAMLLNILDPNRDVDPRFLAYQLLLQDGRTLVGMISRETAAAVELHDTEGTMTTVLRREIEAMKSTRLSLMPEGLEESMSPEAMADLIAYLLSQGE